MEEVQMLWSNDKNKQNKIKKKKSRQIRTSVPSFTQAITTPTCFGTQGDKSVSRNCHYSKGRWARRKPGKIGGL